MIKVILLALLDFFTPAFQCFGEPLEYIPESICFMHKNENFEVACHYNWKGEVPVWSENGRVSWQWPY